MLLLTTNFSYIKKKNPSFVERTETALTDKRQISFLSCTELRALFLIRQVRMTGCTDLLPASPPFLHASFFESNTN